MAAKADKPIKKYTWVPKVGKNVSYKFGVRDGGYAAGFHAGIDISANEGAKIVWAPKQQGRVVKSESGGAYGNTMVIRAKDKDGNIIDRRFAHLGIKPLAFGTKVDQGLKISEVGSTGNSTGPHLHLEQTKSGHKWTYGKNLVRPKLVYAAASGKDPKKDSVPAGVGFASDPNGNNLLARFAKVYGPDAQTKLDEAVAAYNQSGAGTITEQYQGQYGHSYTLTDKSGAVMSSTDEIKKQLLKYVSASSSISGNITDPTTARALTALTLQNTTGGGNMAGITRRLAGAYTGGDQNKAMDLITQAASKHPNKIVIVNPGQPGSYVKVRLANGGWTTNGDDVAKVLASNVRIDGAKPVPYNQQTHQQQAVLSGANGMAVMNRLNLALNIAPGSTERLKQAIEAYNKKNGADITIHGTLGQPGFWLEIKSGNSSINGTNALLNKLKPYAGERSTVPLNNPLVPPAGTPAVPGVSYTPESAPQQLTFNVDKDGNGLITAEEAATALQNATPEQLNSEFVQKVLQNISTVDTNGDGVNWQEARVAMGVATAVVNPDGTTSYITTKDIKPWETKSAAVPTPDPTSTGGSNAGATDGSTGTDGSAGQNQPQQPDNKPKGRVDPRTRQNNKATGDVISISAAAQKSQAILGADLDTNGKLSKKELAPYRPADRNDSGTTSKKELKQYVAAANTDGVAGVSKAEAKVFRIKDVNNDGKAGKIEKKAYKELFGKEATPTIKEVKQQRDTLKGQIDGNGSKQERTTLAMADDYIKKAKNSKAGGTSAEGTGRDALVGGQVAKRKDNGSEDPGNKKKKK